MQRPSLWPIYLHEIVSYYAIYLGQVHLRVYLLTLKPEWRFLLFIYVFTDITPWSLRQKGKRRFYFQGVAASFTSQKFNNLIHPIPQATFSQLINFKRQLPHHKLLGRYQHHHFGDAVSRSLNCLTPTIRIKQLYLLQFQV